MSDAAMRGSCHFGSFLAVALFLYLGLAITLVVRRKLTIQEGAKVAVLLQRQQSHVLSATGTVLGSAKRPRQPYIFLDGVRFPLSAKRFSGRKKRLKALQTLRDCIGFESVTASPVPNSPAAFLALLDVWSLDGTSVRFRAIWSRLSTAVFLLSGIFVAILYGVLLLGLHPTSADEPLLLDAYLLLLLLFSAGLAVILQKIKPTVAITAGKWAEVVEHGATYKCPSWQARFVVSRPDPTEDGGPAYPYIELKYGKRSLTVHSSRMYDAEELEEFAERMNHFLWGGPTQPEDPAATRISSS